MIDPDRNEEIRQAVLDQVSAAFPADVPRARLDIAFKSQNWATDEVTAAAQYLHDRGLISWEAIENHYRYRLTAAGWRVYTADQPHLRELAGHIVETVYSKYPHKVYEAYLLGSLKNNGYLQSRDDYRVVCAFLIAAGYVRHDEAQAAVYGSRDCFSLLPDGVDLYEGKARDEGVMFV